VLAPLTGGVGPGLVQTVENALYIPGAKDVILVVAMELAARHADGQNVNISWLAGNVLDRIQRNEDRAKKEVDAAAPDPATVVRAYTPDELSVLRESGFGLTQYNTRVPWNDAHNILAAQLEEAHYE